MTLENERLAGRSFVESAYLFVLAAAMVGCSPSASDPSEIVVLPPASSDGRSTAPLPPSVGRTELPWSPEADKVFVAFVQPGGGLYVNLELERERDYDAAVRSESQSSGMIDRPPYLREARLAGLAGTTIHHPGGPGLTVETTIVHDGDWLLTLTVGSSSPTDAAFRTVPSSFETAPRGLTGGDGSREYRLGPYSFAVPSQCHLDLGQWHHENEIFASNNERANCADGWVQLFGEPVSRLESQLGEIGVYHIAGKRHAAPIRVGERCYVVSHDCSFATRCMLDREKMIGTMARALAAH